MSVIAKERPGIYSNYQSSEIVFGEKTGKRVGIVAISSCATNKVYDISSLSEAKTQFSQDNNIYQLCEMALKNGAAQISVVSAGKENPDYESAFSILEDEENIGVIICDSEDPDIHKLLKTSVVTSSKNLKERIGIVSYTNSEGLSEWAKIFNCERVVLVAQSPVDNSGKALSSCLINAALAGIISSKTDPSTCFNGSKLRGISSLNVSLSEEQIDEYIGLGITPFETVLDEVEIIRLVTSKTKTNLVTDKTFKELNTVLIMDYVISGIRNTLKKYLFGLKNNSATRRSIATQTTIELEKYRVMEIIDSYQLPNVSVDAEDSSICIVEIEFAVLHGLNQIQIMANIKI